MRLTLFKWDAHIFWNRRNLYLHVEWWKLLFRAQWRAKEPEGGSRAYVVLAICSVSVMLQLYRPGTRLGCHHDGPTSVPTLAIELWSPREGRLECHGPYTRFFNLVFFNGADLHEVTKCSGHRLSLLFQLVRIK